MARTRRTRSDGQLSLFLQRGALNISTQHWPLVRKTNASPSRVGRDGGGDNDDQRQAEMTRDEGDAGGGVDVADDDNRNERTASSPCCELQSDVNRLKIANRIGCEPNLSENRLLNSFAASSTCSVYLFPKGSSTRPATGRKRAAL